MYVAAVYTRELITIAFPIFAFIGSLISQLVVKKKAIVLSILFTSYLITAIFEFGSIVPSSVLIFYCLIYIIIGLVGTLIADLILMCIKRFIK
jgi:hypothetical protein